MNRRNTLKTLMMASAGMVALPAWAQEWSSKDLTWKPVSAFLNPEEEALLASVADTILPATEEGIGALDVAVEQFLLRLFSDCYEPEIQQNIKTQFRALSTSARLQYGSDFTECDQQQRETLLLALAQSEVPSQNEFFKLIKGETMRGFLTSRKVLRDYYDYVVAPGHYYGCVDLNETA